MTVQYDLPDVTAAYRAAGLAAGETVYVTSDIAGVRGLKNARGDELVAAHLSCLRDVVGPGGTIVVPTSTLNLIDSGEAFDPATTKSFRRGALSEAVRLLPDAHRSFHPIQSYAAVGPQAETLLQDVPRHAFGFDSVEWRLVQMGARSMTIGLHPRLACSTVHLMEVVCGAPYRFSKEFLMPVMRKGERSIEPFYFPVYYRDTGMTRDHNRKIFDALQERIAINRADLGRGAIYSYSMADFFTHVGRLMSRDPYIWCDVPPSVRPYQTN